MKIDLANYRFRPTEDRPPCCRLSRAFVLEPTGKGPTFILCSTCARIHVERRGKTSVVSKLKTKPPALLDRDPVKGDKIYVPTQISIDHGEDDIEGGVAHVSKVKQGTGASKNDVFVSLVEVPGHSFNWSWLKDQQKELKKRFGGQLAHPDPDYGG